MSELRLDADAVGQTIDLLCQRVEERFPDSGLSRVGRELARIAKQTRETAAAIARPILTVRVAVALLIGLVITFLASTLVSLRRPKEPVEAFQFIDPEWIMGRGEKSSILPPREMTRFELSRYLCHGAGGFRRPGTRGVIITSQRAVQPPSMRSVVPVTRAAAGEAR